MKNSDFYNILSSSYDSMIDFKAALPRRREALAAFIKKSYKTAADIGCGSGIDSLSLSQLGLKVTAFDPSEEMIGLARKKTRTFKINNIEFFSYAANKIPEEFKSRFDFIVSLGNTFANIEKKEIGSSLLSLNNILKQEGAILIQMVNYNKLIAEGERILNINSTQKKINIRFLDFLEDYINFNILEFDLEKPGEKKLITTKVYNHGIDFLLTQMKNAGFGSIETWCDFAKTSFDQKTSKDIIIYAQKH